MRDYYKYFVAYETYDPNVFSDTPQWNAFATQDEANNSGMTPIFGGTINVIPAWLAIKGQKSFVAFANGARLLGFFANQFVPNLPDNHPGISQGFWYLQQGDNAPTLRSLGYNSPGGEKKGKKIDVSGASGLVEAFLALEAYVRALLDLRRTRDAGIVQFAIDQVNRNIWSITQAFDFLRQNHL